MKKQPEMDVESRRFHALELAIQWAKAMSLFSDEQVLAMASRFESYLRDGHSPVAQPKGPSRSYTRNRQPIDARIDLNE